MSDWPARFERPWQDVTRQFWTRVTLCYFSVPRVGSLDNRSARKIGFKQIEFFAHTRSGGVWSRNGDHRERHLSRAGRSSFAASLNFSRLPICFGRDVRAAKSACQIDDYEQVCGGDHSLLRMASVGTQDHCKFAGLISK
jgi:hypothetical protein